MLFHFLVNSVIILHRGELTPDYRFMQKFLA